MLARIAKVLGAFLAAVILLGAVLTGASAIFRSQSCQILPPTGPDSVGRIELALNDTARVDPFASDGRTRQIAVWTDD
jgi:hypothetical protein